MNKIGGWLQSRRGEGQDARTRQRSLALDEEPAHVDILSLRMGFGNRPVFDGMSCRFPEGKITCILGASGSGKSTLLRMMACLLKPDFGDIWVGDKEITCLPESDAVRFRRRIGMLFQGGALLDSMTVFDNVALPLRENTNLTEQEIADEVHLQFESVELEDVDHLLPGELSGGMRKRAALARAMIGRPEILLCDEPLTGLDPIGVRVVENLLVELNKRTGVTMIIANHHINATLRMSDQIVFVVGQASVCGSPQEFRESIDPRVRGFIDAASAEQMDARRWEGQESEL